MNRFCSAAVFVLLCFASMAYAADKPLIVASDATWPPMEYVDANKQVIGYSTDYINAVAKEAGLNIQIKNTAWDGIFASLDSHQADIIASSVTITEKRKLTLGFTDSYCEIRQAVIVPVASSVQDLQGLAGLKIGGQIGTTGLIETLPKAGIDKKATIKTYDEVGLAIEDLDKGNIDAVVCDSPVAQFYVNKKKEYQGKLKIAHITEAVEYYGFAVRKDDKALLAKLNQGIKAVKTKGIEKELAAKWFK